MEHGTDIVRPRAGAATALALVAALCGLAACSSTTFRSTWHAPDAQPVSLAGKSVAAVFITSDEAMRRSAEDVLAQALRERGAVGFASYTLLSADEARNVDVARAKLQAAGADGIVVMRLVGQQQQVSYVPGMWSPSPWGYWGYGWGAVYSPGYLRSDTIVSVETLVYSLRQDRLLWAGLSDTINPTQVGSFVRELARQVARRMSREGLLAG